MSHVDTPKPDMYRFAILVLVANLLVGLVTGAFLAFLALPPTSAFSPFLAWLGLNGWLANFAVGWLIAIAASIAATISGHGLAQRVFDLLTLNGQRIFPPPLSLETEDALLDLGAWIIGFITVVVVIVATPLIGQHSPAALYSLAGLLTLTLAWAVFTTRLSRRQMRRRHEDSFMARAKPV